MVALDRRGWRATQLRIGHFRRKIYYIFFGAARARERQQSCHVAVAPNGRLTVEIKFDQDVSAGKPLAASARIF
jgi:hypothetical protein